MTWRWNEILGKEIISNDYSKFFAENYIIKSILKRVESIKKKQLKAASGDLFFFEFLDRNTRIYIKRSGKWRQMSVPPLKEEIKGGREKKGIKKRRKKCFFF